MATFHQVLNGLNKMDQVVLTLLPSAQLILTSPQEPVGLQQVEANKGL
jgi:hypothetical protein